MHPAPDTGYRLAPPLPQAPNHLSVGAAQVLHPEPMSEAVVTEITGWMTDLDQSGGAGPLLHGYSEEDFAASKPLPQPGTWRAPEGRGHKEA